MTCCKHAGTSHLKSGACRYCDCGGVDLRTGWRPKGPIDGCPITVPGHAKRRMGGRCGADITRDGFCSFHANERDRLLRSNP